MLNRCKRIAKAIFIDIIAAFFLTPGKIRYLLYKLYGMQVKSTAISCKCFFASNDIVIGEKVFINHGCCFHNPGNRITIGDNTWVAMRVIFTTSTHKIGDSQQRAGEIINKPIHVGKGCWIGANATILPGVTIGAGCIIGAGAVVNKDCKPNGLYVGIPAKRIKDLEP